MAVSAYFDHNATTPLDGQVLEAMLPYLRNQFGNPSSVHRLGRAARAAIDNAREQVAELVGARPDQVIFTSGGTEANNLAIRGVAGFEPSRRHLLVGATEHPSVLRAAEDLRSHGMQVERLLVDRHGNVDPAHLAERIGNDTALVSIMLANNETGVLQDIAQLSAVTRSRGVILHSDAVQAAGKVPVDFSGCGAQLLTLSAHKLHGPKGAGALVADRSVEIMPLLEGGGQEHGLRSGTENVAAIVGFGAAASLARQRLGEHMLRMRALRARLEAGLRSLGGIVIFAAEANRLPNTVCFAAEGVTGETLVLALDKSGMAVSSGSACAAGKSEPNPVLVAMGVDQDLSRGSVRVSLGSDNDEQQVDAFLGALSTQLSRLLGMTRRAYA